MLLTGKQLLCYGLYGQLYELLKILNQCFNSSDNNYNTYIVFSIRLFVN